MARAKRSDQQPQDGGLPWGRAAEFGYDAGGPVARLHADLAQRLATPGTGPVLDSAAERAVRRMSVAGGWAALAMGYAGAALIALRLI